MIPSIVVLTVTAIMFVLSLLIEWADRKQVAIQLRKSALASMFGYFFLVLVMSFGG